MKKILITLILTISLFASIENEIDKKRFSYKDEVLTDSFADMQWQDNKDTKTIKKDWQGAKDYCSNLTLNGKSDWRLPNRFELQYALKIKNKFKNNQFADYWSSTPVVRLRSTAWRVDFKYNEPAFRDKEYKLYIRCSRAKKYDTLALLQNNIKEKIKNTVAPIYAEIQQQNNISGYEWFINTYPKVPQVKEAIQNIYKLAYTKAKQINTISSYNTFIIAYPYALQINEVVKKSFILETNKFIKIKKDNEKKARLLAVKIKKMTLRMKKSNAKIGYEIVIDRMTRLLTEKYEETDASLRYYESKEFTDFTLKFDKTMNDIKKILNHIANDTSDISFYAKKMINISSQGFSDAKADREMSKYKSEQHHKWDKRMHYMEKGYN